MARPGPSLAELAGLLQGLNIPSEVLAEITRDPAALREFLSDFDPSNRPLPSPRASRSQDPPERGGDAVVDSMMKLLQNAKATHLRERSLPPIRALEPPRMLLLQQFTGSPQKRSGTDGRAGFHHRQTYIGVDPDYSTKTLGNLRRVNVSQMLVRKRHEGAYLLCKIISKTTRLVACNVALEDPEGGTTKLAMYHYPFSLDASVEELDEVFSVGSFIAIREPYYKFPSQGDMPMIRVDAPSDIVFLEPDSPLVRSVRWISGPTVADPPRFPTTPNGWKDRGVEHFKRQRWFCAAISFSEGLKLDPKNHLLLLNRAETYLRLGWNISAAHDAETVISMNLGDAALRLKAVFRVARARYCLGDYEDVILLAKKIPGDSGLKSLSDNATKRLRESAAGEYDWLALARECQKTAPRPDAASYRGPVEVKSPGGGKPRGLFVTRDVKAGELLLVSKPIASCYPEDSPNHGKEMFMSFNFLTNYVDKRSHYALIDRLAERMWEDPRVARIVEGMHAGERFAGAAEYSSELAKPTPLSHPRSSSVDIDIARVEGVCSTNSFRIEGAERTVAKKEEVEKMDTPSALYELPSFCNHSCLPTAHRAFFGDVMVLRAHYDLQAGEEITLSYTQELCQFEERSERAEKKWGFACRCPLCLADLADSPAARALRGRAHKELENPSIGLARAKELVESVARSYKNTPERRACIVKPELSYAYTRLAWVHGGRVKRSPVPVDSELISMIEAQMNALEASGLVITDRNFPKGGKKATSSSGLPVDTSKPPHASNTCLGVICQMASNMEVLGSSQGAVQWMKVAVWVHNLSSGGGRALFLEQFKPVLAKLHITRFV